MRMKMKIEKNYEDSLVLAIDIGGSKYMIGFVDFEGNVLYQERIEWISMDEKSIIHQMMDSLEMLRRKMPDLFERVAVGGVTIPGFADPVTGVWEDSDFLDVHEFPICDVFRENTGIPFYADNDCNACALAEKYFGSAQDKDDFLYLTVSTGIGGALYIEGNLYYGSLGHAGEIGLFVVEENGRGSDTGSVNGIVEMYASGRGLSRNYLELGGKLESEESLGGKTIAEYARKNDEIALKAIRREGMYLGRVIANACTFADFQKVIIGGGISLMFEQYKESLLKEFQRILPERKVEIESTKLGYSGAFLGAAAVALRGKECTETSLKNGFGQKITLEIKITDCAEAFFVLDGKTLKCRNARFGEFLSAAHICESGDQLNELLQNDEIRKAVKQYSRGDQEAKDKIYDLGYKIGKGVACACVLLDPGELLVEGSLVGFKDFQTGLKDALIKETYYRGDFPFQIQFQ